jgi:NTP-dependent ternary system trypsin peptidase co-occuring protein
MDHEAIAVPATLQDGSVILVQVTPLGAEEEVSGDILRFDDLTQSVKSIATSLLGALKDIQPDKASLEFGCEVTVESGKLTAMLVKGSGKAHLKVTLGWEAKPAG